MINIAEVIRETVKRIDEAKESVVLQSGKGYEVIRSGSDNEGSYIVVKYKGKVIDDGDYDRGASTFFMDSGCHDETIDILNYHIKNKTTKRVVKK